jgi:predicted TIM-barrel fold metal-dependent hydrolase
MPITAAASRTILGVQHSLPDFAVPPGACDCHTHVFGPLAKYQYSPQRAYLPGDASIEDMLAMHRAIGIERVVIVHPSPYGADNACTVDAVRRIGPAARGVAVIDANTSDADLLSMHEAGIRGIRINLETIGVSDPQAAGEALKWAAKRVVHLGWHVQTFTNLGVLSKAVQVIRSLATPLVVDHIGHARAEQGLDQPGFADLLDLVATGKAYVKLSAPQRVSRAPDCADAEPLVRALVAANPERMLWGSDWPHPGGRIGMARSPDVVEPFNPIDDGHALNRLARWVGDAGVMQKILVDNPARLYGFEA